MKNLGYEIKGFDHCEFYVGNAKQASHFYKQTLGFEIIAYRGLETGSRERVSYVLNQGKINFVLTSPLKRDTSIGKHINVHGDGIRDVAFEVNDAKVAWKNSVDRGAKVFKNQKKYQIQWVLLLFQLLQLSGIPFIHLSKEKIILALFFQAMKP